MESPAANPTRVQFGVFELDLRARELRKSGVKIKLNEQPFQVLALLLEHPGQVVTREELQARLWPADTFVDFDLSLNGAVKKLRQALGDESDNPRFVETLYRRGYRFIAPVATPFQGNPVTSAEVIGIGGIGPAAALPSEFAPAPQNGSGPSDRSIRPSSSGFRRRWKLLAAVALLALLVAAVFGLVPASPPRILGFTQLTSGGKVHQMSAMVTDGQRIYFQALDLDKDRLRLAEVSVNGGESKLIATPFPSTWVGEISPDGSSILIGSFSDTGSKECPIWLLPLPAGSARPLGSRRVHSAVWTPDGRHLLFANGGDLYESNPDGSESRKLATFNPRISDLAISPDGRRIRVAVEDRRTSFSELWELDRDGGNGHRLLPNWSNAPHEAGGRWTPDGRYFLFTSFRDGRTSIWALAERRHWFQPEPKPVQLTNGPIDFWLPVPSKDGKKIFVMGGLPRSEVLQYDGKAFVPFLGNVSATDLAFSADGKRVAYVSVPESALWVSNIDGSSERFQLTRPEAIEAALPRWSPDGRQIVFMGRALNTDWRAFIVGADGQGLRELIPGAAVGFDPGFSPDGKSVVLSVGDLGMTSNKISILDLATQKLSPVPGGDNLFGPRWSPDGRYIAALTTDSEALMLFDRTTQEWTELVRMGIGYPSWSRDGQYIYFDAILGADPSFFRVRISDHKVERLASLKDIHRLWGPNAEWSGLGPDDSLLVTRDIASPEIYALDWQP
jgi:Tol biopolymer transport system component/DNA-binding winged helix-turn-helix (wHTH) protein